MIDIGDKVKTAKGEGEVVFIELMPDDEIRSIEVKLNTGEVIEVDIEEIND